MKRLLAAALVAAAAMTAFAQEAIDAVVVKVDKPAGRLTLRHGAIPAFDMPAMTGAYKVQDPAMLERVRAGDAVQFTLARVNNQYTITRIEVRR